MLTLIWSAFPFACDMGESHTGLEDLKLLLAKRVQCDELKPQCSNCHRYAAECVYPVLTEIEQGRPSETPPAHSPESNSEDLYSTSPYLPMRDLALMHQWSVSTCHGFGDKFIDDADPWREQIPILAQQFPFLMRGILALSAIHLAKKSLDRHTRISYLQTAAYHQDLAIPEYRSALLDVTKENVTAVVAFSNILTIYSFSSSKDANRMFADDPFEWISLHRGGIEEIPGHWQGWIEEGCFHRQLQRRKLQPVDPSLNPEDYRLHCLEAVIATLPGEEMHEASAYQEALYWLRQSFAHTYNQESMIGPKYAFILWIERVPQSYIDLINLQRPRAMIFFANAAVLVKRSSHFWFLEGFAEHLMMQTKELLPVELLPWIDWPMQTCGMV